MNYRNRVPKRLVVAFSGLTMLSVQAADIPLRGPIPFSVYDQNSDGKISQEEFSAIRDVRVKARSSAGMPMQTMGMPSFQSFDLNGDAWLSEQELEAGQQRMQQQRQTMGRGRGRNRPSFGEFDLDGNGSISKEEFLEAQGKRISERSKAGYPMRNIGNIPVFEDIDSNADAVITEDEVTAHQSRHGRHGAGK